MSSSSAPDPDPGLFDGLKVVGQVVNPDDETTAHLPQVEEENCNCGDNNGDIPSPSGHQMILQRVDQASAAQKQEDVQDSNILSASETEAQELEAHPDHYGKTTEQEPEEPLAVSLTSVLVLEEDASIVTVYKDKEETTRELAEQSVDVSVQGSWQEPVLASTWLLQTDTLMDPVLFPEDAQSVAGPIPFPRSEPDAKLDDQTESLLTQLHLSNKGQEEDLPPTNTPTKSSPRPHSLPLPFQDMQDASCSSSTVTAITAGVEMASSASLSSPETSIYQIKWIRFGGEACAVVTQNKNGPCPLISIINVLLLTKRLTLLSGIEYQSGENLMSQLASLILESIPQRASDAVVRNYQQNIQDALAVLPKLQTGLDINVRFSGPRQYEFTQDTLVFDVLDVPVVHGWIVDANDAAREVVERHPTYNYLVEFIITGKSSEDCDVAGAALMAEDWLERTRSQLTYAGLVALGECLENDVPCVLFRNNHFTTIIKHEQQIYALVTDQGYANETGCVWEQMSNIEGDTDFVDVEFRPRGRNKESSNFCTTSMDPSRQMELDLLLAMSLQEEADLSPVDNLTVPLSVAATSSEETLMAQSDFEMARKLQAEEDARSPSAVPAASSSAQGQRAVGCSQSAQDLREHTRPAVRVPYSSTSAALHQGSLSGRAGPANEASAAVLTPATRIGQANNQNQNVSTVNRNTAGLSGQSSASVNSKSKCVIS